MNIAQLKQSCPIVRKKRKRVGRGDGSGHGGTSCRGHKGQKARSGYHRRPYFEGGQMPLIRRLPKRGFSNIRFQTKVSIVNLKDLNKFEDGTTITPQFLNEAGLIKGHYDEVKILGNGELKRRLNIQAHQFSRSAIDKIQQANGSWIILSRMKCPKNPDTKCRDEIPPRPDGVPRVSPLKNPLSGKRKHRGLPHSGKPQ